jgi:hypothetical protein
MARAIAFAFAFLAYTAQTFASETVSTTLGSSETATVAYIQRTDSMEPPDGICPGAGND